MWAKRSRLTPRPSRPPRLPGTWRCSPRRCAASPSSAITTIARTRRVRCAVAVKPSRRRQATGSSPPRRSTRWAGSISRRAPSPRRTGISGTPSTRATATATCAPASSRTSASSPVSRGTWKRPSGATRARSKRIARRMIGTAARSPSTTSEWRAPIAGSWTKPRSTSGTATRSPSGSATSTSPACAS